MWNRINTNLGNVQAQTQHTVQFRFDGNISNVHNINTPCSCTSADWSQDQKTFTIVYTPKNVPVHRIKHLHQNNYTDVKTVTFKATIDGKEVSQQLSIIATVFDSLPKNIPPTKIEE